MTVTNETTLGDIEQNDRNNFQDLDYKTFRFPSVGSAQKFMGQAIDNIFKRCGVVVQPGTKGKKIDFQLKEKGMKVEHRKYGEDELLYKSGLFIYKKGELIGYASSPFVLESERLLTSSSVYIQTTEKSMV